MNQNYDKMLQEVLSIDTYNQWTSTAKSIVDEFKRLRMKEHVRSSMQHFMYVVMNSYETALFQYATGFGKTKGALDIITKSDENILGQPLRVLIIHHQVVHKKNFQDEIKKWAKDTNATWEFITYRSLHKVADQEFDFVIADEAHHFTESNFPFFASIRTPKRILLSASVPVEKRNIIKEVYPKCGKVTVSLHDAQNWGVLPRIRVHVIDIYLDNRDRYLTYEYNISKSKTAAPPRSMSYIEWVNLRKNNHCYVHCTEQEYHQMLTRQNQEYWAFYKKLKANRQKADWVIQTRIVPLGGKRKIFFSTVKIKHSINMGLVDYLTQYRSVIFADRIEQVEGLPFHCVHSQLPKKGEGSAQDIINRFNEEEIHQVAAVNMLNESMNMVNLKIGLLLSLTKKNKVSNIQRIGRLTRASDPILILPRIFSTDDEKTVNKYIQEENLEVIPFDLSLLENQ